jgi:hypothetical protein
MGLLACLFKWRQASASLMVMYALGVIASVPFLGTEGDLRVYAATVIIFPMLSALGLASLLETVIQPTFQFSLNLLKQRSIFSSLKLTQFISGTDAKQELQTLPYFKDKALLIFSLGLAIVSFTGPITIKQVTHAPQTSHLSCPSGLEAQYFRNNPGSSINLVSDDAIIDSHLPNIRISDFKRGLKTLPSWSNQEKAAFAKLNSGLTILNSYNYLWLVTKSNLIPQERGLILACGTRETIESIILFHADYLEPVSSQSKVQ